MVKSFYLLALLQCTASTIIRYDQLTSIARTQNAEVYKFSTKDLDLMKLINFSQGETIEEIQKKYKQLVIKVPINNCTTLPYYEIVMHELIDKRSIFLRPIAVVDVYSTSSCVTISTVFPFAHSLPSTTDTNSLLTRMHIAAKAALYLDKRNFVHRDIKLENMMYLRNISNKPERELTYLRMIDLGSIHPTVNSKFTSRKEITLSYAAPEIAIYQNTVPKELKNDEAYLKLRKKQEILNAKVTEAFSIAASVFPSCKGDVYNFLLDKVPITNVYSQHLMTISRDYFLVRFLSRYPKSGAIPSPLNNYGTFFKQPVESDLSESAAPLLTKYKNLRGNKDLLKNAKLQRLDNILGDKPSEENIAAYVSKHSMLTPEEIHEHVLQRLDFGVCENSEEIQSILAYALRLNPAKRSSVRRIYDDTAKALGIVGHPKTKEFIAYLDKADKKKEDLQSLWSMILAGTNTLMNLARSFKIENSMVANRDSKIPGSLSTKEIMQMRLCRLIFLMKFDINPAFCSMEIFMWHSPKFDVAVSESIRLPLEKFIEKTLEVFGEIQEDGAAVSSYRVFLYDTMLEPYQFAIENRMEEPWAVAMKYFTWEKHSVAKREEAISVTAEETMRTQFEKELLEEMEAYEAKMRADDGEEPVEINDDDGTTWDGRSERSIESAILDDYPDSPMSNHSPLLSTANSHANTDNEIGSRLSVSSTTMDSAVEKQIVVMEATECTTLNYKHCPINMIPYIQSLEWYTHLNGLPLGLIAESDPKKNEILLPRVMESATNALKDFLLTIPADVTDADLISEVAVKVFLDFHKLVLHFNENYDVTLENWLLFLLFPPAGLPPLTTADKDAMGYNEEEIRSESEILSEEEEEQPATNASAKGQPTQEQGEGQRDNAEDTVSVKNSKKANDDQSDIIAEENSNIEVA